MGDKVTLKPLYVLRYIAASIVVFYHFAPRWNFMEGSFEFIKRYGYEPVNFFYFLSGFILTNVYVKNRFVKEKLDFKSFLLRRLTRIYPIYFLSLLLLLIFFQFDNNQPPNHYLSRSIIEIGLIQSWLNLTSVNYPGWSISVEFVFYILFPFLIWVLNTYSKNQLFMVMILVYGINILIGCNLFLGVIKNIEYSPISHLGTFIVGICTGLFFRDETSLDFFKKYKYFIWGIIPLFLAYFINTRSLIDHNNGWLLPLYVIILPSLCFENKLTTLLGARIFINLGNFSYGLYILQFPIWVLFLILLNNLGIDLNFSWFLVYFILLNGVSLLLFNLFEIPIENYLRSKLKV
jgi:peptidoglycan/LPS O-acetylase OafA/YrhL